MAAALAGASSRKKRRRKGGGGGAGRGGVSIPSDVKLANTRVVMTCAEPPAGAGGQGHGGQGHSGTAPQGHSHSCTAPQGRVSALPGDIELCATADLSDRAHNVHDPRDPFMLVSASRLNGEARSRRYPACYMTGAGVSFESAIDDTYAREQRLLAMGLEVGGRSRGGIAVGSVKGEIRLRDLTNQRPRRGASA